VEDDLRREANAAVRGMTNLSNHAYGCAIDLGPDHNPLGARTRANAARRCGAVQGGRMALERGLPPPQGLDALRGRALIN